MQSIEAGIVMLLLGSPLRDHEVIPKELHQQFCRDHEVIPKELHQQFCRDHEVILQGSR